ncbi:Gfo/Idh/MocA family protein [Microcella sp.]|uniref:Gfo/Idh/MocA family protein n=1 Tax=Microcella sp. TaxID=1913979 RepID=UPI002565FE7D|nr:Gfo/Idh/MocA family oxidoreductase [Microcella sp.]MBX9471682.1 Gfo/Idh/MocA family oxidoreductase [Microcella sp.]
MTDFPTTLPTARTYPLRGGPVLRWGILAPGDIAKDFTRALHSHTDQRVEAVASRSLERAQAFAAQHGIARAYGEHAHLVNDADVDIVYVASPHSEHKRLALLAIAAGKHVLIEKPIGVTAHDAQEIHEAARAQRVFVMEGMWSRYLPQTDVMLQLVADGVLGDIRLISADFATIAPTDPHGRNYNPDLAGGSLLDLGIYPLWFSQLFLGAPDRVTTFGSLTSTGVDAQTVVVLQFESGAQSVLTTSLLHFSPERASVSGTKARIEVNPWFVVPAGFELIAPGKGDKRLSFVNDTGLEFRDGMAWEAAAVAQHIADGLTESPLHPLDFSVEVMQTMDAVRRQVGTLE